MEVTVSSIVTSIALVTFLTCAWRVVNWVWLRPKQKERWLREQGFKGNPYKLLYGDTKEMISMMRESRSTSMDSSSDDLIPHVLRFHHHNINLHGITIKTKPISIHSVNTSNYSIVPDNHVHMVPAMCLSCCEMISKWEVLVSQKESCEVDVWPYLQNVTGDVISRTAFGSNYDEGKKIFQLQTELGDLIIQFARSIYIPGWRFLPTKKNTRMKTIYNEVRALLSNIIQKKEQTLKGNDGDNDLLGILLKTNLKESQVQGNKKNIKLTMGEVIEECKLFYLAGQETTSTLLVWTMILLSKHQKWQALAREEVLTVFGNNKPSYEGLNRLKIMTMIFYEVLRLYPAVPLLVRTVHKKTKVGNFVLPPGLELLLSVMSIHRDCETWGEDVMEFKPERFSEGITKATKTPSTFLPFGGGPRNCIGQNFAMIEAKIALAMILQRFSFQLSPSYVHAPSHVFTLNPQHGACLILQKI
ncbi:hypothetical protein TEA_024116 [Camellia sinensis var. sinensis]|uniref:Cytochrome P450 n=1 Tax=Camellia sinensis var. sinensis TaxID=542762 RepID=A0A4S4E035_CAMSN|nr:hypothetical protein TEA_024116 [Camellia sinensis var. sinensis]